MWPEDDTWDSHNALRAMKDQRNSGVSKFGSPGHKTPKCHFKMKTNAADYPVKARDQIA